MASEGTENRRFRQPHCRLTPALSTAPKTHVFWNRVRNGPSRSSKVIDFGTNRKRVCDFLLVINSNLGPILHRFRDIAGFLLRTATHPIPPEFWGVLHALDWRCWAPRSDDPKLINRLIIFEVTLLIWPRHINVTDRETDGRTDGWRTTYCSNVTRCTLCTKAIAGFW